MYTVLLINGKSFDISQSEYDNILGKTGMVYIPSIKVTINMASISCIEPKGLGDKLIDRSKQMEGITPEGERVVKRFGQWYIAAPNNPEQYDDEGHSILQYHGNPLLPSPQEYELKFKELPAEEWPLLLVRNSAEDTLDPRLLVDRNNRTSTNGLSKI